MRVGVEELTLSVPEGALFGFLGPNGAGKTTTIRVLMGFLRPTAGQARIFGLDTWRLTARITAEVGYLPGDLRLYPWLTCRSALRMFGKVRQRDLMSSGMDLAERFDLEPDLRVRQMSRGTRQKLGLVLALAHDPRLLILDEPTAALDPLIQEKLYEHLRKLAGAGHTIFFSSHTLSEVEQLCDRVAILRAGRLVANETLDDLRKRAHRAVTIRWDSDADFDSIHPPHCLTVFERHAGTWHATLEGSAASLINFCAEHPVQDLSISPPDLSTLFHQHYVGGEGDGA